VVVETHPKVVPHAFGQFGGRASLRVLDRRGERPEAQADPTERGDPGPGRLESDAAEQRSGACRDGVGGQPHEEGGDSLRQAVRDRGRDDPTPELRVRLRTRQEAPQKGEPVAIPARGGVGLDVAGLHQRQLYPGTNGIDVDLFIELDEEGARHVIRLDPSHPLASIDRVF